MAFFGYPHAPRATAQGIHFRSTAIVQSVSGDAMDVPLTTEFLRWSYGLGARERQSCPFFCKWRTFYRSGSGSTPQHIAPSSELTHAGRPYQLTLLVSTVFLLYFVVAYFCPAPLSKFVRGALQIPLIDWSQLSVKSMSCSLWCIINTVDILKKFNSFLLKIW